MGFRTENKTGITAFAWYDSRMVTMTSAYILMSIQCIKDDNKKEGDLNNMQSGLYDVDYLYLISENSSASLTRYRVILGVSYMIQNGKVPRALVGEIQEQQLHAGDRSIALLFKYCILQEGVSSNGWSRSKVSHLR
ncbi:hypothetical protein T05_10959 [Trichinella murrelli]|uniref:Uncharacterized protein n=1 Tax=Trichinella murrelli TaxID=144512 RepID=A0A0V0UCG5_9BILA|nr:hypothetical protein T05_10959 [Trichinella murrelli]